MKPEHIALVRARDGRRDSPEGTGARAFAGRRYTHAGKTGTAQVIGLKQGEKYVEKPRRRAHRDHALFIAFAPGRQARRSRSR